MRALFGVLIAATLFAAVPLNARATDLSKPFALTTGTMVSMYLDSLMVRMGERRYFVTYDPTGNKIVVTYDNAGPSLDQAKREVEALRAKYLSTLISTARSIGVGLSEADMMFVGMYSGKTVISYDNGKWLLP